MNEIASMMPVTTHNLFDLKASIEYLLVAERYFVSTNEIWIFIIRPSNNKNPDKQHKVEREIFKKYSGSITSHHITTLPIYVKKMKGIRPMTDIVIKAI